MAALHAATVTELPNHSIENFDYSSQKTIVNLLNSKCSYSLQNLKQAHALILKTGHFQDHYVAVSLLNSYANPRFGSPSTLSQILEHVPQPNAFVWNSVIKGCLHLKHPFEAISMYQKMVFSGSSPNKYTYPQLFKACAFEKSIEEGVQIHGHAIKHGFNGDEHVVSAGIQMYASLGCLVEARNMLDSIGNSDVVCCNAMIDGYMKIGDVGAAKELFELMEEKNVGSWNTMISGFFTNGMIIEAEDCFKKMPGKDEVSWSAMIDGYNRSGCFTDALKVFDEMQREEIKLTKFVLSSLLTSCANTGALDQGKWIHGYVKKNRIVLDAVLGTSMIDMYAKCGRIDLAWDVFERTKLKEVYCWNAMIGGLAMHGRAEDAIELFLKMELENVKPNDVTFIALLNACAHAGLVHQGLNYFVSMKRRWNVGPKVEHYGCVVNLLGKAGYLKEAESLIGTMPMRPNGAVWGALLGACRMHGNVETGERIGEILLDLEPENSGRYTLLSNIYAKAGKWEGVERVRKVMKERGVKTIVGKSMIISRGIVHEFKVGDSSHPQIGEISRFLEKMVSEIERNGHEADTSQVLFDISEEEKETSLKYHSEKIAIAFGILNSEAGETIRVVKNLRVCDDCHSATKIISRVYDREIIVRDRLRYHHFKNGQCSCKDFW